MDPTSNSGGAGGSSGAASPGGSQNLEQLQGLFNQFSQTLIQLRQITTEGQQKMETARAKPQ